MTGFAKPLEARFITSSTDVKQCPEPLLPEYAFIGRSNVGKSSLINMITGQQMLAKISSTPGKTKLINHFLINESWYLVDLPGYGYARSARSERKSWLQTIEKYLLNRTNLMTAFILLDSRLPLQASDLEIINWFGQIGLHFVILLTKTDKLTHNKLKANQDAIIKELLMYWEELPPVIQTSSQTKLGRDEIIEFIEETNRLYKN